MASHKPETSSESNTMAEGDSKNQVPAKKKAASKADLSELLEEVGEMYKTFLVSPKVVTKDDSEGKKSQPWCSGKLELEKRKENSGSSLKGEGNPLPPKQQAAPAKLPMAATSPDFPPEWHETTDLNKCMRNILHNRMYKSGDRLSPEDEVKVRSVFQYHPKAEEKAGPGIDYVKIDRIYDEDTRCFWVVRVDGTAIDFSYHKCLKAKIARGNTSLLGQYEKIFMDFKSLDLKKAQRRKVGKCRITLEP
ncbi:hypothetical protein M758_12G027800 [Ceratodon purpureus]|nr:hypothetical protein M758_12G027800 [Ceratodon purpureus]